MRWLLRTMCLLHIIGNIFSLFKPKPRNPEANMNVGEMISYWGYIYEEYDVVTEDGYIITVYRIPRGKNESRNLVPKPVVYLHHGWPLSASIWILNPPSGSLGFLLADAGFDVWMGNSRGNTYARKHVYLDPDSREFWAFSYDQQIKYNIPATIDFIINKTAQKHIYYVGYSEGTLLAFGAFATNPQLAQKIKINFALGPAATVKHMSGLLRLIGYVKKTLSKILFGEKDIFSNSDVKYFVQFLCQREIIGTLCNYLLTLISGYNPQNLNESRFDVYAGQAPVGTSVQSMLHYSQGIRTGVFQAYDWGSSSLNMLHYSQPTPPLYDVKKMKVPTAMWSGGRDLLADPTDVKYLEANISNLIYHKKIADYSHLDFVIGLNAPDEVFNEIVTFITEDQSG
ncbi:tear acid lipase-like protein [Meriones unguiculatus]|uniref:tear acid lipase-like protein n=1 Tax=Meriones unguiculatus TaxID=10047 RepID=UPI000B4ED073|nr:tear acid lipase-like protein [Meriones unguiculatus]